MLPSALLPDQDQWALFSLKSSDGLSTSARRAPDKQEGQNKPDQKTRDRKTPQHARPLGSRAEVDRQRKTKKKN